MVELISNYCMVFVNVTVNMTPEMLEQVDNDADALGMNRAEYIRHAIRQADDTSFEEPEAKNAEVTEEQTGAA